MQIAELSRRTGVTVASIKYYVREGLLPPGIRSGPNAVAYHTTHERRLRLIRALREIGGLPIDTMREILSAVDDRGATLHRVLGHVQRSLAAPGVETVLDTARDLGHSDVEELLPSYRRTATELAGVEVDWLSRRGGDVYAVAERSVVGTVLGDALLAAVRREEQRRASRSVFGAATGARTAGDPDRDETGTGPT